MHPENVAMCHNVPMRTPKPGTSGARLRAARKARGLSQVELSAITGFSRAYITHLELNTQAGGLAAWQAIGEALNVGLDHLLGRSEAGGGMAEAPAAPIEGAPMPDQVADFARFGELAAQVEDLLRAERMPHDTRTVGELAARVWQDVRNLPAWLPFEERLELSLSERRSMLRAARASMFAPPERSKRAS